MIEQYPVTPPPELVAQIRSDALRKSSDVLDYELRMIHAAYRAGADQELEACCGLLQQQGFDVTEDLRATRRPKPPSLAEQAISALYAITSGADDTREFYQDVETVKAALERLQELEGAQ